MRPRRRVRRAGRARRDRRQRRQGRVAGCGDQGAEDGNVADQDRDDAAQGGARSREEQPVARRREGS